MKVVIVHASPTPYARARLAAAAAGAAYGDEVWMISIAGQQSDYRWEDDVSAWSSRILFPSADYWAISRAEVRHALSDALDEMRPEVVVLPGWGFKEAIAGLGWAMRNGIARVVVSDSHELDGSSRLRDLFKRTIILRFNSGFVAGATSAEYLARLGIPRALIFTGCDVVENTHFESAKEERAKKAHGPPVLMSATRLLPRKNIHGVLDALSTSPGWRYRVAGAGPELDSLVRHAESLGVTERVTFLGHVEYGQLPQALAGAHVYVQPSTSEPWGLAVNEAMAAGLPVIVSRRCGCWPDLVEEGKNGFTFDPHAPGDLAHVLQRMLMLRDRWAEMGSRSQEIISAWGPDRYADGLLSACRAAIDEIRKRPEGALNKVLSRVL